MEIALAFKGDAFRVVYALQRADEIWVVHVHGSGNVFRD